MLIFLSICSVWYYFGMVGSFIFIIIQLVLLVDFAHSWNQSWLEKAENGNSKCWYAGTVERQHTLTLCLQAQFKLLPLYNGPPQIIEQKLTVSKIFLCVKLALCLCFPHSSVVFHHHSLRLGFCCRRALLRVLHPTERLHGAQGLHQPQLNILHHCVHCGYSSQSPGNVYFRQMLTSVLMD